VDDNEVATFFSVEGVVRAVTATIAAARESGRGLGIGV
jgi:hypothetical protein